MNLMVCRVKGRAAYIDGKSLYDNPYRYGTQNEAWLASRNGDIYSAAWADGFLDAAHGNFQGTRRDMDQIQ